jgi:hypothetical protein
MIAEGRDRVGGGAVSLNAGPGWKAVRTGDFNGGGQILAADPGPSWHAVRT